ncbi:MAG: hypothetical protein GC204_10350 [Chloroflexi bacterium]|nr:hypothetical protein [Chloroflexota bacterium]
MSASLWMARLGLRLALVLIGLTTALLLLIGARHYDSRSVTAFFGDSCTMLPCWQGIRPGVTTFNQALGILHTHPWVNEVSEVYASPKSVASGTILIYWTWRDAYPYGGRATPQGIAVTDQGVVVQLYLTTTIPFGDLWLTLGGAQGELSNFLSDTSALHVDHTALFTDDGIAATASLAVDCVAETPDFWHQAVFMWLRNDLELPTAAMSASAYLRDLWTQYPALRAALC